MTRKRPPNARIAGSERGLVGPVIKPLRLGAAVANAPPCAAALAAHPAPPAPSIGHLVGARLSYADLSLFQAVEGLGYALPNLMRGVSKKYPRVMALRDAVAERPRISAYLQSARRIAFNEHGIFRHYAELDE